MVIIAQEAQKSRYLETQQVYVSVPSAGNLFTDAAWLLKQAGSDQNEETEMSKLDFWSILPCCSHLLVSVTTPTHTCFYAVRSVMSDLFEILSQE